MEGRPETNPNKEEATIAAESHTQVKCPAAGDGLPGNSAVLLGHLEGSFSGFRAMWRNAQRGSGYGEQARDGAVIVSHPAEMSAFGKPRGGELSSGRWSVSPSRRT